MPQDEIVDLYLPQLREALTDVVGEDLADSLVKASMHRGELTLDMQLAINDGLEILTDEKREEVISIIEDFRSRIRSGGQ